MTVITATCLLCKADFYVELRNVRRKNLHHHCIESNREYHAAKAKAWNRKNNKLKFVPGTISACCLYCREEFVLKPERRQTTHGCKKAQAARRNYFDKTAYKAERNRKEAQERKSIKIKNNLHPCPKCHIVMTANHYACSQCWERINKMGDVDTIMAWNTGEARRVSRPRASYDWAY